MDVTNTTSQDPMVHLGGLVAEGNDGYITGQERRGQTELVHSELMPTEAPWADLVALGFVRGEVKEGDEIFTHATLPEGWSRKATDHSMWSTVVDERGIERVAIFYKAAFYDRSTHASIRNVGALLAFDAMAQVEKGGEAALPEQWGVLTEDERGEFVKRLHDEIAHRDEYAERYNHTSVYGDAMAQAARQLLALVP